MDDKAGPSGRASNGNTGCIFDRIVNVTTPRPQKKKAPPGAFLLSYQSAQPYQYASADEASDQIAQPDAERNTEKSEDKTRHGCADDTENDIHEYPGIAVHEIGGNPAGQAADNDCRNPAYSCASHREPS